MKEEMQFNIHLSHREGDIISLLTLGKSRKVIAGDLGISIHTVDTHLRNIHLKTGTHSLTELIIWSLNHVQNNN